MPVTARLLQRLHEALGDEATNDLLAWWEEAATVNRAAVREVADLYFERFSDQLERGLAEVRAEFEQRFAEFRTEFEKRFAEFRTEFEKGLAGLRAEFEKGLAGLRAGLEKGMIEVRAESAKNLAELRSELRTELASQRADLIKWMFIFWVGTVVPLAGLLIALTRL